MRFLTLRYFNEVAKLGSIRRAADRLHVAPSAVSRQISQLEHELDAVLFQRSKTGLKVTAAGEALARQTNRIFRDLERARTAIDDLRGLKRGTVSLWVMEGVVSGFLPPILAEFGARYPAVTFNVQTASTDRMIEALIEDEADIALTFRAAARPEIEVVAEFAEPIACLLAPGHELAGRPSLTLAEICRFPLALPEHSFGLRQIFERAAARLDVRPKVFVTTNSLELTKTVAATGRAIAFMPAMTVVREIVAGRLLAVPVEEEEFRRAASCLSVHRDRPLPHAAAEFLRVVAKALSALSATVAPRERSRRPAAR